MKEESSKLKRIKWITEKVKNRGKIRKIEDGIRNRNEEMMEWNVEGRSDKENKKCKEKVRKWLGKTDKNKREWHEKC